MKICAQFSRDDEPGLVSLLRELAVEEALRRFGWNPLTVDYRDGTVDQRGPDGQTSQLRCFCESDGVVDVLDADQWANERIQAERERLLTLSPPCGARSVWDVAPRADAHLTVGNCAWQAGPDGSVDPAFLWAGVEKAPSQRFVAYGVGFGCKGCLPRCDAELTERLARFDAVSVCGGRDERLATELGLQVERVVDPILLLSGDDWRAFAKNTAPIRRPYALMCIQGGDPKTLRHAWKALSRPGLEVVEAPIDRSAFTPHGGLGFSRSQLPAVLPTPGEFVGQISNAGFVLTDSTCIAGLCVALERPFAALAPDGESADGMSDLLLPFGLEKQILGVLSRSSLADRWGDAVNWRPVRIRLDEERRRSLKWLKRALH